MKRTKQLFLEIRQIELKQELESQKRYERFKAKGGNGSYC